MTEQSSSNTEKNCHVIDSLKEQTEYSSKLLAASETANVVPMDITDVKQSKDATKKADSAERITNRATVSDEQQGGAKKVQKKDKGSELKIKELHRGPDKVDYSWLEERVAHLCNERIWFGPYPESSVLIYQLHLLPIDVWVNLMVEETVYEKVIKQFHEGWRSVATSNQPVATEPHYIHFAIPDQDIPTELAKFRVLLKKLVTFIKEGKRVYIHCEHGRGRSGLTVACLLLELWPEISVTEAIDFINRAHRNGHGNTKSGKWHKHTIPPHDIQKRFIKHYRISNNADKDKVSKE